METGTRADSNVKETMTPDRLAPGPYRLFEGPDGVITPWYMIPFDKRGRCVGHRTREHLLKNIAEGDHTDAYVFAHGWNNAWPKARSRYKHFIEGYSELRGDFTFNPDRTHRPLLIGIFWPSAILTLPWERSPAFAAASLDRTARAIWAEEERRAKDELASELPVELVERFCEIVQMEGELSDGHATELAGMLAPLYFTANEELPEENAPPKPDELIAVWGGLSEAEPGRSESGDFGIVRPIGGEPVSAGSIGLRARDIVRAATVWLMKDRAGTVGMKGLCPLLADVLTNTPVAKVHLIGHSYGCKLLLSAICGEPVPRPVDSLLLLQPAVNHLCFSADATGTGRPGGYRVAFDRVEQPILSTFSTHDTLLTRFFHLALRRGSDLGEPLIAGAPPSRYAALGGYGPAGCEADSSEIQMRRPGWAYDLASSSPAVYGVNGTEYIKGHNDVSNPAAWWALHCQVAEAGAR